MHGKVSCLHFEFSYIVVLIYVLIRKVFIARPPCKPRWTVDGEVSRVKAREFYLSPKCLHKKYAKDFACIGTDCMVYCKGWLHGLLKGLVAWRVVCMGVV